MDNVVTTAVSAANAPAPSRRPPSGMATFSLIWAGQLISLTGSAMTWFALTVWVWEQTGQATPLTLVSFFSYLPGVLFSPLAGALVDRWNRKLVMLLSDSGSALATVVVCGLYLTHNLQVWHIYVLGGCGSLFLAFQFPAYSAAVTLMVSKSHYSRAQAMLGLAQVAAAIVAPAMAAALWPHLGLAGISGLDIASYLVAVATVVGARIPQPPLSAAGRAARGSLWSEAGYGFRYIYAHPSLCALTLVVFVSNLIENLGTPLIAPLILARSANDAGILGSVQSFGAVGGLIGGIVVTLWGGPRNKVQGVLLSAMGAAILGTALTGIGRSRWIWTLASFDYAFFIAMVDSFYQAFWQVKVAPDIQGRVFAARSLLAQLPIPLSMLACGPLADRVFEPALHTAGGFTWLVGSGPGAGMALMLILAGSLQALVCLGGGLMPVVRYAEELLPDQVN